MRVPVEAKALRLVANKLDLSVDLAKRGGLKRVLCAVENEDLAVNAESGDDVGVLRLVTGLVDLSRMLNLLDDVALDGGNIGGLAIATNFPSLLVVVVRVRSPSLGDLDVSELNEVGALIGSVCAEQEAMDPVVLVFRFLDVGEPLNGECRPSERRTVRL